MTSNVKRERERKIYRIYRHIINIMSFINTKKRDEVVKSYLAIKIRILQRNINQKLGDMAQSEDRQKMFEPIIKSNFQSAEESSKDLVPIRKELDQVNNLHLNSQLKILKKCYNHLIFHQQGGEVYQVLQQNK